MCGGERGESRRMRGKVCSAREVERREPVACRRVQPGMCERERNPVREENLQNARTEAATQRRAEAEREVTVCALESENLYAMCMK